MKKIELTIGEWFSLDPLDELGCYHHWAANRRLIIRNGRPVGHWTSETCSGKGTLWLQNYAGYYHSDFFLVFDNIDLALERAKEILTEWDSNPARPTWIA